MKRFLIALVVLVSTGFSAGASSQPMTNTEARDRGFKTHELIGDALNLYEELTGYELSPYFRKQHIRLSHILIEGSQDFTAAMGADVRTAKQSGQLGSHLADFHDCASAAGSLGEYVQEMGERETEASVPFAATTLLRLYEEQIMDCRMNLGIYQIPANLKYIPDQFLKLQADLETAYALFEKYTAPDRIDQALATQEGRDDLGYQLNQLVLGRFYPIANIIVRSTAKEEDPNPYRPYAACYSAAPELRLLVTQTLGAISKGRKPDLSEKAHEAFRSELSACKATILELEKSAL